MRTCAASHVRHEYAFTICVVVFVRLWNVGVCCMRVLLIVVKVMLMLFLRAWVMCVRCVGAAWGHLACTLYELAL